MRSSGGGYFHTNLIGDYTRLGMTVWFSEEAMADILAMCDVERKFRVTMDTAVDSIAGFTCGLYCQLSKRLGCGLHCGL